METLTFTLLPFKELSGLAVYNILYMREHVFQLEQQCIYRDIDGLDVAAFHLLGYDDHKNLVAYCRLLPPGTPFEGHYSIGRVLTMPLARNKNYGRSIMQEAIRCLREEDASIPVKIGAQLYLEKFYESFGFSRIGSVYDEDGIDHIHMILPGLT